MIYPFIQRRFRLSSSIFMVTKVSSARDTVLNTTHIIHYCIKTENERETIPLYLDFEYEHRFNYYMAT